MTTPPTKPRRRRDPVHPLRIVLSAVLIALLGFLIAAAFSFSGLGIIGVILFYAAIPLAVFGLVAWATLLGIRYYDHEMRQH